jgi:hypothetical protein
MLKTTFNSIFSTIVGSVVLLLEKLKLSGILFSASWSKVQSPASRCILQL